MPEDDLWGLCQGRWEEFRPVTRGCPGLGYGNENQGDNMNYISYVHCNWLMFVDFFLAARLFPVCNRLVIGKHDHGKPSKEVR